MVDQDLADFHIAYLRSNMESSKSFFIDGLNVGLLIKKPLNYVVLFTFYSMEKHRLPFAIPGFEAATFFVQLFEQRRILCPRAKMKALNVGSLFSIRFFTASKK